MIANYINIEGGTNYKLDITSNDLKVQNPEFRLVCKTDGGAINIELPIIKNTFDNNFNAKIFIDDADDMAETNNITISMATEVVSATKRVLEMVSVLDTVAIVISGNHVRKLTPSIGGDMVLANFGEESANNGSHVIDSIELFTDEKVEFTRIFSSTLVFEESLPENASVTADVTLSSTIENDYEYIVSKNGSKLQIFISSSTEYGVLSGDAHIGATKKLVGLINGLGSETVLRSLKSEVGSVSISKVSTGVFLITSDVVGAFTENKTVYPNPQIVAIETIESQMILSVAKFTYVDSQNIRMETFYGITGAISDVTFTNFPLELEIFA